MDGKKYRMARRPAEDELVLSAGEFVRLVAEVLGCPRDEIRYKATGVFEYEIARIDRGEPVD